MSTSTAPARRDALAWISLVVAAAALAVVVLALVTRWDPIDHGHPAYAVLLGVTAVGAIVVGALALRPRRRRPGVWRRIGRGALIVLGVGWIAVIAWLQPYRAVPPAIEAMQSDAAVTVTETPTGIVLEPVGDASTTAVLFQPGALVDARAYVPTLRPIAEAGVTVVIPKQPLGIAFLALGVADAARADHPDIEAWILGGHSLGGTVAAMEAAGAPDAVGLLLLASYPSGDLSGADLRVLSISGSRDGLATPAKIEASRADLPASTEFVVIEGASHAQFGSYGRQAGDGDPTIGDAEAREAISDAARAFVLQLAR